ncbi:MAG: class I SAM-dependent methyltransferase [Bryobacteraceae bacterium]
MRTRQDPHERVAPAALDPLRAEARAYYDARVATYGATPAGVDWNSEASQTLRFEQLARLWEREPEATVLDYGCGYGALAIYIRQRGHTGSYVGFDLSDAMVTEARRCLAPWADCQVTTDPAVLVPADYAVASGVFNVKQGIDDAAWHAYVLDGLAHLATLGTKGFAFNLLTAHSDAEKRRADLYYADPFALFDHCRRTYSQRVALLHDYPLYEFTILVRR